MKLRCWPGAIAWINRSVDAPENVGAVVRVERLVGGRQFPCGAVAVAWSCVSAGPLTIGWYQPSGRPRIVPACTKVLLPDQDLTPFGFPDIAEQFEAAGRRSDQFKKQIDEFVVAVEQLARELERVKSPS